jgi:hypothetical protein
MAHGGSGPIEEAEIGDELWRRMTIGWFPSPGYLQRIFDNASMVRGVGLVWLAYLLRAIGDETLC